MTFRKLWRMESLGEDCGSLQGRTNFISSMYLSFLPGILMPPKFGISNGVLFDSFKFHLNTYVWRYDKSVFCDSDNVLLFMLQNVTGTG